MSTQIEPIKVESFTRVNSDINGNPRYVIHFLAFVQDLRNTDISVMDKYKIAVKRANKIGGRKYHNKQYGGGIVFQSYSIQNTAKRIDELNSEYAN